MPPSLGNPNISSSPSSSPAAPLSTRSISPPPPSKQPHLSSPFFSHEGVEKQMTAEETEEDDEGDARLASLITDDANWPTWIPIQEVWMSGGLGSRGEQEEGEEVKGEVEGCEEGEELLEQGKREVEKSQGEESAIASAGKCEGEEVGTSESDENQGGGSVTS